MVLYKFARVSCLSRHSSLLRRTHLQYYLYDHMCWEPNKYADKRFMCMPYYVCLCVVCAKLVTTTLYIIAAHWWGEKLVGEKTINRNTHAPISRTHTHKVPHTHVETARTSVRGQLIENDQYSVADYATSPPPFPFITLRLRAANRRRNRNAHRGSHTRTLQTEDYSICYTKLSIFLTLKYHFN